ncbi:hypothetical protein JR316_0005105 [Psilocybe cubensis]|uniref:Uncharacterized protein n=2 Tax=Psilocybe cubensis TaxID=181762 RepID=A0ACB8H749_PSICU|nr:hypothetical protein JR316_0005105 [Psilocybe cubensis]KAH9483005.1 hypothetical protein JR316_0005105 [Psilocybe cubensis]
MRISARAQGTIPVPVPMISAPPIIDTTPYSPAGLLAVKIYVFGGLAFMIGVVLTAIGFWIYTVVIRGEYADSPPWLDLHPERMREKEKARIARLKQQKAEKIEAKKRKQEEKFTPPPVRYQQRKDGRNRAYSLPAKPALRKPSDSSSTTLQMRKSSMSSSPTKGKRVSWASSTSTLDVNGCASEKPIEEKTVASNPRRRRSTSQSQTSLPPLPPLPSLYEIIHPLPEAHTYVSPSVELRARRGRQMIAMTTPEIAARWAMPNEPITSNQVDPLDEFKNPC